MNDKLLEQFLKNLSEKSTHSIEEIRQYFDGIILSEKTNKDGERLVICRKTKTSQTTETIFDTRTIYSVFKLDATPVSRIVAILHNKPTPDEIELEYSSYSYARGKGNVPLALDEILKDIFVNQSHDNITVRTTAQKSKIETISLSINPTNSSSIKVAKKCGFTQTSSDGYQLTKEQYLKRIRSNNENFELI